MMAQEKAKFEVQIAKERTLAEEMAKKLEGVVCKIPAKVSEEDRLYDLRADPYELVNVIDRRPDVAIPGQRE